MSPAWPEICGASPVGARDHPLELEQRAIPRRTHPSSTNNSAIGRLDTPPRYHKIHPDLRDTADKQNIGVIIIADAAAEQLFGVPKHPARHEYWPDDKQREKRLGSWRWRADQRSRPEQ